MHRLAIIIVSLIALAGCKEVNPNFCPNGTSASATGASCLDAPPGTGDHCTATTGCTADPMFPICDTAKNGGTCVQCNIVWNNNGTTGAQVGGNCLHAYSDVGPISIIGSGQFDGGNNLNMDPMFANAATDLNLTSTTPLRGNRRSRRRLPGRP
jgi:hypothetical protein